MMLAIGQRVSCADSYLMSEDNKIPASVQQSQVQLFQTEIFSHFVRSTHGCQEKTSHNVSVQ